MISGRQALASIENAISSARAQESQLDAALRSAGEEAGRLRAERASLMKELARIRLDTMQRGEVTEALDSAERRAMELIRAAA
jgi:regulator of replication initiation timing